jgi:hypothetical protein
MADEHGNEIDPDRVHGASGGPSTRADWSFKPGRLSTDVKLWKLAREREDRIRDLGGLTLEMVRRERLNPDLLAGQAGRILELERLAAELEEPPSVPSAQPEREGATEVLCVCGWALEPGARFCSHCGRPTGPKPPDPPPTAGGW